MELLDSTARVIGVIIVLLILGTVLTLCHYWDKAVDKLKYMFL